VRTPYGPVSRRLAIALAALALAGCGDTTTKTVTERETVPQAAATTERSSTKAGSDELRGSEASTESATKKAARSRTAGKWVSCDSNVTALRPHTSCGFAQNAFYGYWSAEGMSPIDVWSPSTKRTYSTRCTLGSTRVTCRTSDGGRVRFPTSALQAYSSSQAAAYAASHDVGPELEVPTEDVADATTPDYDYDEPAYDESDSSAGDEIPNYDNGTGYRVQCADGMYSQSGGRRGACSGHGGVG